MHVIKTSTLVALTLVASAWASSAAGAAARVEFVMGKVVAVDRQGRERALLRGGEISQGDTIDTRSGRVQLRFSDGAYVSLQPQSKFRIDTYRFNGKGDGTERGFFSLLQGGLRTITGVVGRSNKQNYQVTTAVATIGIRGTEYTVQYGNSVTGSVGEGEIAVCNGTGCLNIKNGESYLVAGADQLPVITRKKTDLPPPQPESPPAEIIAGDTTTSTGTPAGWQISATQQLPLGYTVNVVCITACPQPFDVLGSDTITFKDDGSVASVNSGNDPLTGVSSFGNDGFIAWGVGKDKYGQFFHYVTGFPAAYSDLSTLAASQPVAYYDLIGSSTPTAVNITTGATVSGKLTSGTLEAHFGAGYVNAELGFDIDGTKLNVTAGNMGFYSAGGVLAFYTDAATCTVGVCSGEVKGFIGTQGLRAGTLYRIYVSGGVMLPGPILGTAAFTNRSPAAVQ